MNRRTGFYNFWNLKNANSLQVYCVGIFCPFGAKNLPLLQELSVEVILNCDMPQSSINVDVYVSSERQKVKIIAQALSDDGYKEETLPNEGRSTEELQLGQDDGSEENCIHFH